MLNKVILMGRITADPDLRYTPQGTAVLRFSLAVQRSYVKQGEERQTDFINCVAFKSTAEFISKWFAKGSQIVIVGNLQSKQWEEDGKKRYGMDVIVDESYFCDKKQDKPDEEQRYTYEERKAIEAEEFMSQMEEIETPF